MRYILTINQNSSRFQPIDPDTLIYSDDDENGEAIHASAVNIHRNAFVKRLSNFGLKSDDSACKNRRLKQVTRKVVLPKGAKKWQDNVLSGKDLDSISPLIKRLLVDTYENHKKQQKHYRSRGSRRRKSNIFGCDNIAEDDKRRVSITTVNKWRKNVNRSAGENIYTHATESYGISKEESCNATNDIVSSNLDDRKKSSGKSGIICKQISQSLEDIADTECKQFKSNSIKRKVI